MADSVSEELEQLTHARLQFLEQGQIQGGLVDTLIERSWKRCVDQGLAPWRPDCRHLASRDLKEVRERNEQLLRQALPELEELRNQVAGSGYSVFLTDSDGVVLYSGGDPDFVDKAQRVALQPGACWNERDRGTNAIGTAIAERSAVMVHGAEHYLQQNGFLTCSAVPICDPHGEPLGVLDISGEATTQRQLHTLALVRMASTMIENRYFSCEYTHAALLHFHTRLEFIGTLSEGLAAFDPMGRLLAANRSALLQLGLTTAKGEHFATLFSISFDQALAQGLSGGVTARTRNGVLVHARMELQGAKSAPLVGEAHAGATALDQLRTGDEALDRCLRQAGKVLGRGIPILIEGETGTGKEVLAKAIHDAGPRRDSPLVTVNCAALPQGLIESELFGYTGGAFTGARREGVCGKIAAANGGTLFLDEIGDMPLDLQTRLLRVLQERQVTRLGGGAAQAVDFDLICATNRNLQTQVARGEFRADLYYRINGLCLRLPPLRERSDLATLAPRILAEEAAGAALAPDVMAVFRRHPWPGNIRQLRNVLRTAAALRDDAEPIQYHHLPEDFLAECDALPGSTTLVEKETQAIRDTLAACNGNMSVAARRLGINRSTLYRKLRQR